MSIPAPVLVYGWDSRLVETRRLVLETLGGKVYSAADRQTTEQLVSDLKPGVLVLCYRISDGERDLILSFVQAAYASTKILILRADGLANTQAADDFSIYIGPAALRQRVAEMLATPTVQASA